MTNNKDYLKMYAAPAVTMHQMGGSMPAGEPAPAAEGAPQEQGADVEAMLQQYAQSKDPQLAVAICDTLVAMMQGGAPEGAVPASAHGGRMHVATPTFRKGGKLKA